MIVSDAGPIIIFARIGRLSLLHEVTGSLTVPAAVYDEIVVKKSGMPGTAEVAIAGWIHRAAVAERATLGQFPPGLHAGEREAIALAKERGAQLLIDGIHGRRVATDQKIEVIGTLRILSEAKRRRVITTVRPIIGLMQSRGYRFDRVLVRRFLERMDEA